jgi:hypothetical protein
MRSLATSSTSIRGLPRLHLIACWQASTMRIRDGSRKPAGRGVRERRGGAARAAQARVRHRFHRPVHGLDRPDHRRHRPARHRAGPARLGQLERLDHHHLRARPGHRHADGRQAQRHLRPQDGLPRRDRRVHDLLAVLRLRREHRPAADTPVHPGARRRRVHALGDRDRLRPLRRGTRSRRRHVHLHPPGGRDRRPHHRRGVRDLLVLARHLPRQRADRNRADRADRASTSRARRPGRTIPSTSGASACSR